jgi:hypothetical protein
MIHLFSFHSPLNVNTDSTAGFEFFILLAKLKGMSEAARALDLTPPAKRNCVTRCRSSGKSGRWRRLGTPERVEDLLHHRRTGQTQAAPPSTKAPVTMLKAKILAPRAPSPPGA